LHTAAVLHRARVDAVANINIRARVTRLALATAPTKSPAFSSGGLSFVQDRLPPIIFVANGQHRATYGIILITIALTTAITIPQRKAKAENENKVKF